ncbi:alpha-mannosidase [Agromyces marinus]|uniref:alpha-mannosidase n=1 Tax=Agromyces marinus TaxID=1389020 RepID=UPI002DD42783|nr:glycoside hydrolase family 38 C-terminal domain-containing protein [Agromyces marinus]
MPITEGTAWGRPWGTTWFAIDAAVPEGWSGAPELVVDLGFIPTQPGFQCEGLAYDEAGNVVKALESRNMYVPLRAGAGGPERIYVEAASNPDIGAGWSFAPTALGSLRTAGEEPLYRLGAVRICERDETVFALERDVDVLLDTALALDRSSARRAGILRALDRFLDMLDFDDISGSATEARGELEAVLSATGARANHEVVAVGHAHIDSAWLWPVRETKRKVARTFSNVLALMEEDPDFVFAASSAQQYDWLRETQPALFDRVRSRVAEGRFVPVGGMWVESDVNLPGGEALVRQFLLGKRFFMEQFGYESRIAWLPDSFGYSPALPQIVMAAGCDRFLTQKPSWNEVNRMPHHTFLWEGLDGSRVLTHFPPVDTYNSDLSAAELDRAARQHAEKGISDQSLVPFGYGNGGGGPTREMLATARRKRDLDGSARVRMGHPEEFYDEVEHTLVDPPVWRGEMYLEFHRGTYTSQARTKLGNRRCEHLLREAELWATTAALRKGYEYPADALRRAWETVLLQQFHDILPGSSIAWVHEEAERNYALVQAQLESVVTDALNALGATTGHSESVLANAAPVSLAGIPPMSVGTPVAPAPVQATTREDGSVDLANSHLSARISADGTLSSLVDRESGREIIPPGTSGNVFELFRDTPNQWDAWDIDKSYRNTPVELGGPRSVRVEGGGVVVEREVGRSHVSQRIALVEHALEIETTVQWRESQRLLKLGFPIDVHTDHAASEVQFGHVHRPTHTNTSWDDARFETFAHRWVRLEERDFGVTIANDRTYGRDITRHPRLGGGTYSLVRESLLRAPRFPDPDADQGEHVFRHSVVAGDLQRGIAEGYRLNLPLRGATAAVRPIVAVDSPGVLVEAVKLAEDGSGDLVVRMYESQGARATASLSCSVPCQSPTRTDLLERDLEQQPDDPWTLHLRPFELATVRLRPARAVGEREEPR